MTDDLVSAEEARRLRDIYDGRIEFISRRVARLALTVEVQAWRIAELEAKVRDEVDRRITLLGDALGRAEAAERRIAELEAALAATVAELDRWGWGDYRWGTTEQDPVVAAAVELARASLREAPR